MSQLPESLAGLLPTSSWLEPAAYASCVRELLLATLSPKTHYLPLEEAAGQQLAESLQAPRSQPSFTNSQMDGYALTDAAARGRVRVFRVGQDIAAGSSPAGLPVSDDLVYPVMTGAPLPAGYTTVVPVERTRPVSGIQGPAGFAIEGGRVEIPETSPGAFVRQVGEDLLAGANLAAAGSRLTPALIGALAAQGIREVKTYRPLHLLIMTGGDELAREGEQPGAGQIFDSNGPMLAALGRQDGCRTSHLPVSDSVEGFRQSLGQTLADQVPDFIVTSGGISHGKYEVVRLGLEALAAEPSDQLRLGASWFGHVSQQPGGPQGLALVETAGQWLPVLCLPGNPVSSLVSYHLLLRPALASLAGEPEQLLYGRLQLQAPITAPEGKTQYRRARLVQEFQPDGSLLTLLCPDPGTGSHLLHQAAQAQALVELAAGATYRGGELVPYIPLGS